MGKLFRWTLLFVVLVIFASGAVAVYTVFFSTAGEVVVPSLREMSVIDAVAQAERLGFTVKVEQTLSSLPAGQVLTQYPEAGVRARRDKIIILQVSRGGVQRAVPDVRGLDLSKAQSVIQEQGFGIGDIVRIRDDSRPAGAIIAQSPAAPANIPGDSKIDLLVNQGGAPAEGKVMVPDVARMTERQAREVLAANGLKVAAVDYVYSAGDPDGSATGTRPAAGTTVRPGDGVRLKVTTTKRPEGAPEAPQTAGTGEPASSGRPSGVVVTVPGHGDIPVGGMEMGETGTSPARELDPNVSVFDQQQRPRVIANPTLPPSGATTPAAGSATTPATTATPQTATTQPSTNLQPTGGKIARIRYQVPPLARPLKLKIDMVDPSGTRVLLERDAKSGEYVSLDAPYSKECAVTIYLGGEFVWQDKYM